MTPMQRVDLLKAACCVAGADGVSTSEISIVDKLANDIGVGKASLDAMLARAARDPDFYREQFKILKEEPNHCMNTLMQVALADGSITENETKVLGNLANQLGMEPAVFSELLEEAKSGSE